MIKLAYANCHDSNQLMSCVQLEDVNGVLKALDMCISADFTNRYFGSPFHVALRKRNTKICDILLKSNKASVDYVPVGLEPYIVTAVQSSDIRMVKYLLKRGANPRTRCNKGLPVVFYGTCPGKVCMINELMGKDRTVLQDLASHTRDSIVMCASAMDNYNLCRQLCESTDLHLVPNICGANALMLSAFNNSKAFVTMLQFLPLYLENYSGQCALSYAIYGNNLELFRKYWKKPMYCNMPWYSHCLGNWLYACITCGNLSLAKEIVTKRDSFTSWRNRSTRDSIWHGLACHADVDMLNVIAPKLDKASKPINISGLTPMMSAKFNNNVFMTQYL